MEEINGEKYEVKNGKDFHFFLFDLSILFYFFNFIIYI